MDQAAWARQRSPHPHLSSYNQAVPTQRRRSAFAPSMDNPVGGNLSEKARGKQRADVSDEQHQRTSTPEISGSLNDTSTITRANFQSRLSSTTTTTQASESLNTREGASPSMEETNRSREESTVSRTAASSSVPAAPVPQGTTASQAGPSSTAPSIPSSAQTGRQLLSLVSGTVSSGTKRAPSEIMTAADQVELQQEWQKWQNEGNDRKKFSNWVKPLHDKRCLAIFLKTGTDSFENVNEATHACKVCVRNWRPCIAKERTTTGLRFILLPLPAEAREDGNLHISSCGHFWRSIKSS